MYRIFCQSYKSMMNSLKENSIRYNTMLPVSLLTDPVKFHEEAQRKTNLYQKASNLLCYLGNSVDRFPKFKAFLWTLDSRGIYAQHNAVSSEEELEEQAKGINSILSLSYWQ